MKRHLFCIVFACIQLAAIGVDLRAQDSTKVLPVEDCDLIRNPDIYDGRLVTFRATYRYGFEWQEIYCLGCRTLGKTWLEISQISKTSAKILKKLPADDGTVNASFTGTFHSSAGPFGDGGYRFRLMLRELSRVELLTESGADPSSLPNNVREKICRDVKDCTQ